jgi:hypothetical protein
MLNYETILNNVEKLKEDYEKQLIDTQFEKNKLYAFIGNDLVSLFKQHKVFIAGGLITSLFTNREINDIDVYFRSKEALASFIEDIYENGTYISCNTKKATLFIKDDKQVQAIHFDYYKSSEDIFRDFDFTINMGAFDFSNEQFYFDKNFFKHNSQRLIQFNKETAFPLISLMRIKKYDEKGYTISKPEMYRIIMTCMDLKINSYEELKEQLGGLYGVNMDKAFEEVDDSEFSLGAAVDVLQNLHLSEDYFKEPSSIAFNDVDDLLSNILDIPVKYFEINDEVFRLKHDGSINYQNDNIPDSAIEVAAEDVIQGMKLYKFVEENDGILRSFHSPSFKYVVGEEASTDNRNGLYFDELHRINHSTYSNSGGVLIECTFNLEDFMGTSSEHITVKKCTVERVVPKEEYEQYL